MKTAVASYQGNQAFVMLKDKPVTLLESTQALEAGETTEEALLIQTLESWQE